MEYVEPLYRRTSAEPDDRPIATQSDSPARSKSSVGDVGSIGPDIVDGVKPLLYTSAIPAAHARPVQIITRPLSSVPFEANLNLTGRERFRLAIALVVTVLYLSLLSLMVIVSNGTPDIGVIAKPDALGRQVVTWVVPYGFGYDQGVHQGDVVESISSQGHTQVMQLAKSGDTSNTLTVTTANATSMSALQRWSFIILALIFIGVGAPVYIKARQRAAASTFYAFCIASAVCLAVAPNTYLGYGWVLASMFISLIFWGCMFALFFLKFPVQVGGTTRRHLVIVSILVAGGCIVVGTYLWVFFTNPSLYKIAPLLGDAYLIICMLVGLVNLVKSLFAKRSPEVRGQMAILLGGTALAVGPSLLLGVAPALLNLPHISVESTALSLGIMPISFAYAITQHQLLGVRSFVRRGTVYVVMGFVVLLAFSVAVGALSALVPQDWQHDETGLIGFSVFVFLIALSYGYVQKYVERLVDKYIYHDAYDYKEALLQFSAQLAAEQNLHTLAEELVQRTCRLMNLNCGVLLLAVRPGEEANTQGEDRGPAYNGAQDAGNGHKGDETLLKVVPYARYGDFAESLIEGLQYELSQLGIRVDRAGAPMQIIYFNDGTPLGRTGDTAHLKTQPLTGSAGDAESQEGIAQNTEKIPGIHRRGSEPEGIHSRSFLGVPLWTRSRFVGVLCLGGKRTGERFTRDDLSLLSTLGSQAALAIYNAHLYEMRQQALLDTIAALAHSIEAKDGYTIKHCENMTERAVALAQALDLPAREVENIRMGAILHDIGKIGIPDAVLNKPGRLTPEEYELMKQHAEIGARIVQSVGALQGVVPIVRHHQERYDGSGYPEGLKGEAIPLGARIIGVVDAYGAMTEDRVYRAAPGHDKAIAELTNLAGKQFDPCAVAAFVRLLAERPDLAEWRTQPSQ